MTSDFGVFTSCNLAVWPFELKIGAPLTSAVGNVYANFDFSALLCFRVTSPYGTDGRTDGWARRVGLMRPIGRPHNNVDQNIH